MSSNYESVESMREHLTSRDYRIVRCRWKNIKERWFLEENLHAFGHPIHHPISKAVATALLRDDFKLKNKTTRMVKEVLYVS